MKKPIRLVAFVFFLFAIYLNVFYKEDSFLSRITHSKNSTSKVETTSTQPEVEKSSNTEIAALENK
jgi:hypothetical protein